MMPRLLLGAALAFWGWRSGNYAAAAALALLAEAPRVMRLRFELRQPEFARIADLCTVLFIAVVAGLFATVEPPRIARAVLTTLLWLPAVLMPILLAQQLSSAGRVPLSALFRYVRKRRERDPSLPDPPLDLRPIYFAVCLVAAGIPNQRDALFYVAVVVLVGWALASVRPRHASLGAWAIALLAAAGIGYGAYQGLGALQASLEDWVSEWYLRGMAGNPYRSTTDLGSVGRLKMIDSIVLRVYATGADALRFRLLHRASFTTLSGTTWLARNAPLSPLEPQPDGTTWRIAAGDAQRSVRIVTRLERGKALLALPAGTVLVSDLAAAAVRRNALGATEADLGGDWAPYVAEVAAAGDDYAPPRLEDLQLPQAERAEIEHLVAELGLKQLSGAQALQRVRAHFAGFAYAYYRDAPVPAGSTALGDFLRRSRSGHCEYFAAATTLVLRAAGIPARYATGFAVYEYSTLENAYLVRARHAHAWTRAHVDGRWVDVDTTPPSWIEAEERRAPFWEGLADLARWAGFRWSQRGALELGPAAYAALALLIGVFGWRLTRVKRAAARSAAARRAHGGEDSEFYAVEKAFAARYGARAAGESLAAWATRIARSLDANRQGALHHALSLHNRYRFDPAGLDAPERSALRARCLALAKALD
jgi:transglutaminase-like putative cysteine protease